MSFNFTVIKRNQILAGAVTLMLVTAGYLNYKYDPTKPYDVEITGMIEENLGDAVLVDYSVSDDGTTPVFQNNTDLTYLKVPKDNQTGSLESANSSNTNLENASNDVNINEKDEKVFKEIDDYFIATRIDRTNNYAEQIESYENILNSSNVNDEQKNKAQEEIEKINGIRNSIMIAENLIKLKGFEDAIILVNDNSINVVVASENLTSAEVAQIQSIIVNEFSIDIGNVHIINYD